METLKHGPSMPTRPEGRPTPVRKGPSRHSRGRISMGAVPWRRSAASNVASWKAPSPRVPRPSGCEPEGALKGSRWRGLASTRGASARRERPVSSHPDLLRLSRLHCTTWQLGALRSVA
eukprot:12746315-Alexandrium_andersonii.AAC.1